MAIEVIGIVATIIVLLSFVFKEPVQIRAVNAIGAVLFVIYGIMINALSVWLLNLILIVIQLYNIIDLKKRK